MPLEPGAKLGPYTLASAVGHGGMGEVYAAHDERLGRDVAIKVLPDSLRGDPDALARFEREARAVGALSHPNIVAIHDVGASDGVNYVVMELLEGETLRSRLESGAASTTMSAGSDPGSSGSATARGGGLPIKKSLEIAQQIAHGLAAAHAKGIVHRDLKPENVFLTTDGRVKILDFGLARAVVAPAEDVDSRTVLSPAAGSETTPGTVMGTVGYMAPEQVRGETADHRADIFAFGTLLFEILTGGRAFAGDSAVETMNAILKADPLEQPATAIGLPPAVEGLIRHCLEKQPDERFQSARDLAFQLQSLQGGSLSSGAVAAAADVLPVAGAGRLRLALGAAAGGLLLGALGMYAMSGGPAATTDTSVTFDFALPEGRSFDAGTTSAARFGGLAVSPDGRSIAFTASSPEDGLVRQLFIRSLDDRAARAVPGTEAATMPFWSPDGTRVAFCQDFRLKYVALDGGVAQELSDCPNPRGPGSWGLDDTILMVPVYDGPLLRIHLTGEAPEVVLEADASGALDFAYFSPLWLADGVHFLVVRFAYADAREQEAGLFVGTIGSDSVSVLVPGRIAEAAVDGNRLLYRRGTELVAQSFDPGARQVSSSPRAVADGVSAFSAAGDTLAYYDPPVGLSQGHRLTWFDRTGTIQSVVGGPGSLRDPRISPDSRRLAYARADENGLFEIWSVDLARDIEERMSDGSFVEPVWAPDSQAVVAGPTPLLRFALGALGGVPAFVGREGRASPTDWWRDGDAVILTSNGDVVAWPLTPDEPPTTIVGGSGTQRDGAVSPDGKWIAYADLDASLVKVTALPGPGPSVPVAADGGRWPRWRRDGRELFFIGEGAAVVAVPVDLSGQTPSFGTARPLFTIPDLVGGNNGFDVTADGQCFVAVVQGERDRTPITVRVGGSDPNRE